jgi:hypothetical protein
MKSTKGDTQSWWATFPGVITAIATLITALGGLIVILNTNGCFKEKVATLENGKKADSLSNSFIEEFDNNANEWYLDKKDYAEIRILNGKLYITCNPNGLYNVGRTSTWSKLSLDRFFPKYTIDVYCNLISEKEEGPYGFILTNESYDEYYQINYFAKGYGNLIYVKGDSILDHTNSLGVGSQKNDVKLTLKVSGNSYKYYIDNNLIHQGDFRFFDFYTIRLFASSTQTVEFNRLEVTQIP